MASQPLGDTAGKWVEFTLPEFVRTPQERGTELKFELVLDGPGAGELAGLAVELEPLAEPRLASVSPSISET